MSDYLTSRHAERKEVAEKFSAQAGLKAVRLRPDLDPPSKSF
jgi:hypothetical protein